jgi:hypothetical protein
MLLSLAMFGARPVAHSVARPDTAVVHLAHAAVGVLVQPNTAGDHARPLDLSAPDTVLLVAVLVGLMLMVGHYVLVRRYGTAWMASRAPPSLLR